MCVWRRGRRGSEEEKKDGWYRGGGGWMWGVLDTGPTIAGVLEGVYIERKRTSPKQPAS